MESWIAIEFQINYMLVLYIVWNMKLVWISKNSLRRGDRQLHASVTHSVKYEISVDMEKFIKERWFGWQLYNLSKNAPHPSYIVHLSSIGLLQCCLTYYNYPIKVWQRSQIL